MDPSVTVPNKKTVFTDEDGTVFSAYLTQMNESTNTGKFYLLQIIETTKSGEFAVWTRWGKVGSDGQSKSAIFTKVGAMNDFEKKFKEKTGRKWSSRAEEALKGKYSFTGHALPSDDEDGDGSDDSGEEEDEETGSADEEEEEEQDSDDHDDDEGGDVGSSADGDDIPVSKSLKVSGKKRSRDHADHHTTAEVVGSHGHLVGPLINAVTNKPHWKKKLKVEKIVANWKKEYHALVGSLIPPNSIDRLFNMAILFLRQSAKHQKPEEYDGIPGEWALKIERDSADLILKCGEYRKKKEKTEPEEEAEEKASDDDGNDDACSCAMCEDGRFVDPEEQGSDEDEDPDGAVEMAQEKGYTGSNSYKELLKWQKEQCRCYMPEEELKAFLKKKRERYLHRYIVEDEQLIPDGLKHELQDCVRRLEELNRDEKDWHPGSGEQVLDLVHPSLFCFVKGVTDRTGIPDALTACKKKKGGAKENDEDKEEDEDESQQRQILFHWLPTDFTVGPRDEDSGEFTSLKCDGYINNLVASSAHCSPTEAQETVDRLQKAIVRVLRTGLPSFELIMKAVLIDDLADSFAAAGNQQIVALQRYRERMYETLIKKCTLTTVTDAKRELELKLAALREKNSSVDVKAHEIKLKAFKEELAGKLPWELKPGQKIQVITKLANIVLTPEKPTYNGGVWHLEGIPQEKIAATGIYYYQTRNITENHLEFRVSIDDVGCPQDGEDWIRYHTALPINDDGERMYGGESIALGSANTVEGKFLFFPNFMQHKLSPMSLVDKTKPGVRKILVFFFIDPRVTVPSTSDVPCQRQSGTMTLDEAKGYREMLMHERKFEMADADMFFQRNFSLCEH